MTDKVQDCDYDRLNAGTVVCGDCLRSDCPGCV